MAGVIYLFLISMSEKEGIKELTSSLREQLIRTRRAERFKQRLKKQKAHKGAAQFIKDTYRFTKSLLGEARSGTLTSSKEVVEESVEEVFSDPTRDNALEGNHGLINIDPPTERGIEVLPLEPLSSHPQHRVPIMERGSRGSQACKIIFCSRSQWYNLQSIQKMPQAPPKAMEAYAGDLVHSKSKFQIHSKFGPFGPREPFQQAEEGQKGALCPKNRDPHRSASSELSPYLVWRERFSLLYLRRE